MGIDKDFASAYAKAQIAAGQKLPTKGKVFLTMVRAGRASQPSRGRHFPYILPVIVGKKRRPWHFPIFHLYQAGPHAAAGGCPDQQGPTCKVASPAPLLG
jgi:hypothetical protein